VLVGASISQLCASGRWEIFRFLSFVSLRWMGMHVFLWHVLLRRSLSALFAYTLFAFAMALLALLAPPEFAAFSLFVRSFVRLSMH
jgi:hypothetical protein